MSSIERLLEDTLITDFRLDSVLGAQLIRNHDYDGVLAGDDTLLENEALSVIVVTANDGPEVKFGSGIKSMPVQVLIRVNGEADGFTGDLLDDLSSRVVNRMQSSPCVYAPDPGLLSTNALKIYGFSYQGTDRTENGFERMRTVKATITAAQIA